MVVFVAFRQPVLRFTDGLCSFGLYWLTERAPSQSPVLYHLTVGFEDSSWLCLSKIVSGHLVRRALDNGEFISIVRVPEPVPFSQ